MEIMSLRESKREKGSQEEPDLKVEAQRQAHGHWQSGRAWVKRWSREEKGVGQSGCGSLGEVGSFGGEGRGGTPTPCGEALGAQ